MKVGKGCRRWNEGGSEGGNEKEQSRERDGRAAESTVEWKSNRERSVVRKGRDGYGW